MSVHVYGINHVAIEVDDVDAFFKLGEHQFLAMFEVDRPSKSRTRHFGLMVRDERQIAEVREKLHHEVPRRAGITF